LPGFALEVNVLGIDIRIEICKLRIVRQESEVMSGNNKLPIHQGRGIVRPGCCAAARRFHVPAHSRFGHFPRQFGRRHLGHELGWSSAHRRIVEEPWALLESNGGGAADDSGFLCMVICPLVEEFRKQ
jgi:hypothetical protein